MILLVFPASSYIIVYCLESDTQSLPFLQGSHVGHTLTLITPLPPIPQENSNKKDKWQLATRKSYQLIRHSKSTDKIPDKDFGSIKLAYG